MQFQGTYTALITPFKDGVIDEAAFEAIIQTQIEAGIEGIVPAGTTGESPTLNPTEHLKVIELAVKYAAGKTQVIAGTGANSTLEAIELTKAAQQLGVDASLQVCPYYNKPSQDGLFAHFGAIADSTDLPIVLYSIPGRSVVEIAIDTVADLAVNYDNIVAIKEAGGNVDRINQLKQICPDDFTLISGDDPLTLPFISCGAKGVISVISNLCPGMMKGLVDSALAGDFETALLMQQQYYPLLSGLMSLGVNPVPIKTAMAAIGKCEPDLRLPLVSLNKETEEQLRELLTEFHLI